MPPEGEAMAIRLRCQKKAIVASTTRVAATASTSRRRPDNLVANGI
jgi:hypothetical protein